MEQKKKTVRKQKSKSVKLFPATEKKIREYEKKLTVSIPGVEIKIAFDEFINNLIVIGLESLDGEIKKEPAKEETEPVVDPLFEGGDDE